MAGLAAMTGARLRATATAELPRLKAAVMIIHGRRRQSVEARPRVLPLARLQCTVENTAAVHGFTHCLSACVLLLLYGRRCHWRMAP
jgi:hypothetical protein